MKKEELNTKICLLLDELYGKRIIDGDEEYYCGALKMAGEILSRFGANNVMINRDENGEHFIIDYNKP